MTKRAIVVAAMIAVSAAVTSARSDESVLPIQASDTVKSVLERSVGQSVGLRVGAGDEIRGKVAKVGDKVVHIAELAGRELFDAVVPIDSISAVIVKARGK